MASLEEEQTTEESTDEETHDEKHDDKAWKEAMTATTSNWKMVALLVMAALYLVASIVIYMPTEDWGAGDCLYYAVVVATTVGYGDYLPTTNAMKIATIIFVHFGLSIVVLALGIVQDFIVHVSISRAVHDEVKKGRSGLFDTKQQKTNERIRVAKAVSLYILFVIMGTIFFGWEIKSNDSDFESDAPFLDGLYLTVITLSTVGFGDLSPVSDVGKAIGSIFMLTGIPVFAYAFSMVNDMLYTAPDRPHALRKIRANKFDVDKFVAIEDFVKDMRTNHGVGNYAEQGEGNVSRLEFLAFVLVQNGCCDVDNVTNVMTNFDMLDKTGSGFISKDDVSALSSRSPKSIGQTMKMKMSDADLSADAVESVGDQKQQVITEI